MSALPCQDQSHQHQERGGRKTRPVGTSRDRPGHVREAIQKTPKADEMTSASADPRNTIHLLLPAPDAYSIVLSWVLSPSSATKTVQNTVVSSFMSIVTLFGFGATAPCDQTARGEEIVSL